MSAAQSKERLYVQLSSELKRMSRALSRTADLTEQVQHDLIAMRLFAGLDAAKLMSVAAKLNEVQDENEKP